MNISKNPHDGVTRYWVDLDAPLSQGIQRATAEWLRTIVDGLQSHKAKKFWDLRYWKDMIILTTSQQPITADDILGVVDLVDADIVAMKRAQNAEY